MSDTNCVIEYYAWMRNKINEYVQTELEKPVDPNWKENIIKNVQENIGKRIDHESLDVPISYSDVDPRFKIYPNYGEIIDLCQSYNQPEVDCVCDEDKTYHDYLIRLSNQQETFLKKCQVLN